MFKIKALFSTISTVVGGLSALGGFIKPMIKRKSKSNISKAAADVKKDIR